MVYVSHPAVGATVGVGVRIGVAATDLFVEVVWNWVVGVGISVGVLLSAILVELFIGGLGGCLFAIDKIA